MQLLLAYTNIQDEIITHTQQAAEQGFISERQKAVYDSMKVLFPDKAEEATRTLFDLIDGELNIVGWESKSMVLKDIENKLMRFLATMMDRASAKLKAIELLNVIKRN